MRARAFVLRTRRVIAANELDARLDASEEATAAALREESQRVKVALAEQLSEMRSRGLDARRQHAASMRSANVHATQAAAGEPLKEVR